MQCSGVCENWAATSRQEKAMVTSIFIHLTVCPIRVAKRKHFLYFISLHFVLTLTLSVSALGRSLPKLLPLVCLSASPWLRFIQSSSHTHFYLSENRSGNGNRNEKTTTTTRENTFLRTGTDSLALSLSFSRSVFLLLESGFFRSKNNHAPVL